jgi:glucans biosynthesis protein C
MLVAMLPLAPSPAEPVGAEAAAPSPARKGELDRLRLGTILLVFLFHTARFFDPEGWHVKNAATHPWLLGPMLFFVVWAMPLLFVISGAAVFFSLRGRSVARYLRERVLRLLVPLAIGTFTHVMWQVYLERVSHGQFDGSFLEFVPRYFDGLYGFGGGNFAWMGLHLWYLELLFVFSIALLPVLLWLGPGAGRRLLGEAASLLARPGAVFLLAIPVVLAVVLPRPGSLWGGRFFGGWNVCAHACFFLCGFVLVSSERLYQSVRRQWPAAALVAVAVGVPLALAFGRGPEPAHASLRAWISLGGMALVGWSAVLAFLGGAIHGLRGVPGALLQRASEAVLPFYVLHQTVILTIGYPVVRWPIPDLAKWAVIALSSFAATIALYELLVRPFAWMRVLFGMPARARRAA